MEADFWHQRWQSQQIGFHQSQVNSYLQDYWSRLNVAPGTKVLVPLCGKTLDMIWLAAQGHQVVGVELSELAVQAFFDEQRLPVDVTPRPPFVHWKSGAIEILVGDFFELSAADLEGVGAVYDRAALIALPPEMRRDYADRICELVGADTKTLLVTLDYDQTAMSGPPFSVGAEEVRALFGARKSVEEIHAVEGLHELPPFAGKGVKSVAERVFVLAPR